MKKRSLFATMTSLFVAACGAETDETLDETLDELTISQTDRANARIPDDDPSGISRQIDIAMGNSPVAEVRVAVQIRHTYRGDLRVVLRSPSGTELVLHDQTGGSRDNLNLNRTAANFNGEGATGAWTLTVSDLAKDDVGTLVLWGLRVNDGYGNGAPGARCRSNADCREELYCGSGGRCNDDGRCREVSDCEAEGNSWVHVLCVGSATCNNGQCGWRCGGFDPCAAVRCRAGTRCEVQEVVCIRAPCPPIAQCVPIPCSHEECGVAPAIATRLCPDGSSAGPVCTRNESGQCGWQITECPRGPFCGTRGNESYCAVGEYCHYDVGAICGWADAPGECRRPPQACAQIYAPVCGCDNQTYSNACTANSTSVSVQYQGPCGTWDRKGADFGTTNPYRNNEVLENTFYPPPDGTRMKLNFDRFDTEANYDFVRVYDATGRELARYHGARGAFEAELAISGDRIVVRFTSDGSVTRSGFHIDAVSWFRTP